jgi:hypothetical protein
VFKRDSQSHRSGHRTLSRLVFIGIFFFLVGSPDSRAQGIPTLDGNEWEFLRLINEYRAQLGAPALQVSAALTNAAKWHTSDMARNKYYSHTDSLGRTPPARMAAYGYAYRTYIGENIAVWYSDAAAVFNVWRNSAPHDAGMRNPNFQVIGIGRYEDPASPWVVYWTTDFGGYVDQVVTPASPTPAVGPMQTAGVYRPSDGTLYLRYTNTTGYADLAIPYGLPGDYGIAGDWDGDGIDTIGIYRNGVFFLRNSNTAGYAEVAFSFGQSGDLPLAGDWDGDGRSTVGVYRQGLFLLRNSLTEGPADWSFTFGGPGDLPVVGDWDGNQTETIGVYQSAAATFLLRNTNSGGAADLRVIYGVPGDLPMAGDWDGDGVATIGIYRRGMVALRNTNTAGYADLTFSLGIAGDLPLAGRWR